MGPVELRGELVAIEPLGVEHAAGLLAAADADEVFAWLPYPRPTDLEQARAWIDGALDDRHANRRFPFAILDAESDSVIGSTSYWDFDSHNRHVEIGSTWLSRPTWRDQRSRRPDRAARVGLEPRRLSRWGATRRFRRRALPPHSLHARRAHRGSVGWRRRRWKRARRIAS
jgi:Acetyltransferase (GNAT) domain